MKLIFWLSILSVNLTCTQERLSKQSTQVGLNGIDSLVRKSLKSSFYSSKFDSIYVSDSVGSKVVNLNYQGAYTHEGWSIMVVLEAYHVLYEENLISDLLENDASFYVQINHEMKSPNSVIFRCTDVVPVENEYYKRFKWYKLFSSYSINKMTPSDFQAYDWALSTLKERTGDDRFNLSFHDFLFSVSRDEYLDQNEEFIFNKLIQWSRERGDIETDQHFLFFKSKLVPLDLDVPVVEEE